MVVERTGEIGMAKKFLGYLITFIVTALIQFFVNFSWVITIILTLGVHYVITSVITNNKEKEQTVTDVLYKNAKSGILDKKDLEAFLRTEMEYNNQATMRYVLYVAPIVALLVGFLLNPQSFVLLLQKSGLVNEKEVYAVATILVAVVGFMTLSVINGRLKEIYKNRVQLSTDYFELKEKLDNRGKSK
jgi:arginine exporter protein ArgO